MSNGNLVVALDVGPNSFDPYVSNNLHSHAVIWSICEPLFDVGEFNEQSGTAEIRPLVARPPTQQGLDYRFELRENVLFHDDTPFDANAVVQNLQYAAGLRSFRGRILRDLIRNVAPAGNSVTISLNYAKVDLLFLALMNSPETLGRRTSGTGPFMLTESSNPLALVRNPNYREAPRPGSIGSITFRVLTPPAAISELRAGRVHFVRAVYPDQLPQIEHDGAVRTPKADPRGIYYLGFHLGSKDFRKKNVRQAFRKAIDFERIKEYAKLEPAVGLLPPGVEAYDRGTNPARNFAEAKKVLEQEGVTSEIPLLINQDSWYAQALARRIEEDLQGAVALRRVELPGSNALLAEIDNRKNRSEPYLFIYNWYSILPAAEVFLRPLFERRMPDNLTGYGEIQSAETNYKEFDRALNAARTPVSSKERIMHYREAHRTLVDDAPAIFLGHPRVRYSAHRTSVSGLEEKNLNVQSFPVDRYHGVGV